jgi:AraC-like DNA-binding protein
MEINKLIFTIAFSSGIVFGIVFLWYLYFYKKYTDKTTGYLIWFLLAFTLNNIQILWVDNFVSPDNCYLKNLHPFFFFVFVVPYFHAFIVSYLQIESQVRTYVKLAKIIFIVGMVARLVLLPYFKISNCVTIGQYVQAEEIVIAILSLLVFLALIRIVYFKKHLFKDLLSYDKLQWINQFLILGAIVLGLWILAIVINFQNYVNPQFYIYYPLRISSSVLLYWVAYTGSFKKVLTSERVLLRKVIKNAQKANFKVLDIPFDSTEKFKIICAYIDKTSCYLNPDYNLEQLSEAVGVNKNNVSAEINKNAKQNFNDFINSYRVTKAKMLLKNSSYNDYTIDAIGFECGFNSKSTFYGAFKKVTNTTPAAYKKIIF